VGASHDFEIGENVRNVLSLTKMSANLMICRPS